jgi:hypothetical protein
MLSSSLWDYSGQAWSNPNLSAMAQGLWDQKFPSATTATPVGTGQAIAGATTAPATGVVGNTPATPYTPYVNTYNPTPVDTTESALKQPTIQAILDQLSGKVSSGTQNTLSQYGAERGAGGGFGVDNPNANAAVMRALGLTAEGQVNLGIGHSTTQQGIDNQAAQWAADMKNNQEQFASKMGLSYDELNEKQREFVDSQAQQQTQFDAQLRQRAAEDANRTKLGYYQARDRYQPASAGRSGGGGTGTSGGVGTGGYSGYVPSYSTVGATTSPDSGYSWADTPGGSSAIASGGDQTYQDWTQWMDPFGFGDWSQSGYGDSGGGSAPYDYGWEDTFGY